MPKEILCFGDSNTHGYNSENNGRFPIEQRWTGILAGLLGEKAHVIEEGLSGRTCVFDDPIHEGLNGLSAVYGTMMTHEPLDTMVIMLGTNDTKERFGASAPVIGLGMQRLVQKALITPAWRALPDILIVAPVPIDARYSTCTCAGTMGGGCAEKSEGLAAQYTKIVAALPHCRFFDAAQIGSLLHPNDYMHLAREGHAALAHALAPLLDVQ